MLQKLSPRKAAGVDKISSQLLRIAAPFVARLINFPFSSGSFFQNVGKQLKFLLCIRMVTHGTFRTFDQHLRYLSFLKLSKDICMTLYTII